MDDPGWSWPAWKFGLKRADLFSSLHEQYNTFTFSIQDPQAFHADVNEISHDADTLEEFHRLLAERRQQRLQELHDTLEALALEIIANPKLMDSNHWEYAMQLFRTKSFDSLVRYFASYLPDTHTDSADAQSEPPSPVFSDATSVRTTSTKAGSVDGVSVTQFEAPTTSKDSFSDGSLDAPLSPPASEAGETLASSIEIVSQDFLPSDPPSPSMSFSGSESGAFCPGFSRSLVHDDDTSSQSDCDTAVTSVSDSAESRASFDSVNDKNPHFPQYEDFDDDEDDDEDDLLTAQFPEDSFDTYGGFDDDMSETHDEDTATPRPETAAALPSDYKSVLARRITSTRRRSPSPRSHTTPGSPTWDIRRSPDEVHSRIQKPTADPVRKRPKGRI
ncbi:unnamed protein product [Clonostachys byssicola]|uniref:Uncharacterized protein n=1 Tax=Clonostachys byssicola TaxID=160290 RepID=A0A9N9UK69_9HYPO|nr:unnamed protein product [Clonostachys byssicola]